MRVLTNLLFKVTLSSMIVTAPAMITGNNKDANYDGLAGKETPSFFSAAVIKKFVNHDKISTTPLYKVDKEHAVNLRTAAKSAELSMVVSEAVILYNYMSLEQSGLDEKAFEYAWRGYHNLVKKGLIRRKNVLSICDFTQPSCSKRLYVIDVRHKKLLYRTYVAHGQNSGAEYASSFSNQPESFKSSLGFYITKTTYFGKNGLSLRIEGLDSGFNDLAGKRNIVLHGSSYVSQKFIRNTGAIGTSLGCPAMPSAVSPRIIKAVKNGSCLFIYHPTQQYLDESSVING